MDRTQKLFLTLSTDLSKYYFFIFRHKMRIFFLFMNSETLTFYTFQLSSCLFLTLFFVSYSKTCRDFLISSFKVSFLNRRLCSLTEYLQKLHNQNIIVNVVQCINYVKCEIIIYRRNMQYTRGYS